MDNENREITEIQKELTDNEVKSDITELSYDTLEGAEDTSEPDKKKKSLLRIILKTAAVIIAAALLIFGAINLIWYIKINSEFGYVFELMDEGNAKYSTDDTDESMVKNLIDWNKGLREVYEDEKGLLWTYELMSFTDEKGYNFNGRFPNEYLDTQGVIFVSKSADTAFIEDIGYDYSVGTVLSINGKYDYDIKYIASVDEVRVEKDDEMLTSYTDSYNVCFDENFNILDVGEEPERQEKALKLFEENKELLIDMFNMEFEFLQLDQTADKLAQY